MKIKTLLDELVEFSKKKKNWYSIASSFETYKKQIIGDPDPQKRIKEACDATGYSLNTMNRMLSVKDFFDSVKNDRRLKEINPNNLSFSSLEIVKRLYQIDPTLGMLNLIGVSKKNRTIRELKDNYNKVFEETQKAIPTRQAAHRERRSFEREAILALEDHIRETSELDPLLKNLDIGELESNPGAVEAFTVHAQTSKDSRYFLRMIAQKTLFSSNFAGIYWVLFSDSIKRSTIDKFIYLLEILQVETTYVAIVEWKENKAGKIKTLRKATRSNEDYRSKRSAFLDIMSVRRK